MHELVLAGYAHALRAACLFVPGNPKLVRRHSRLLKRRGDLTGALALVEQALSRMPGEERLRCERLRLLSQLAMERSRQGDAETALSLIQRLLAGLPTEETDTLQAALPRLIDEYVRAVVRVARTRLGAGDPAGALGLVDQAIVRVGEHPDLVAGRAAALHELGRYPAALKAWRRYARDRALETRAWIGMARALYMMDQVQKAERLVDEYLGVLSDRPDRHARAAQVALAGRGLARFECLLKKLSVQAEDDDERRLDLAALHLATGRIGEALNWLDRLPRAHEDAAARRRKALDALRVVGIDAQAMAPADRAELRMPDLALSTIIGRAPPDPQPATARAIFMAYTSLGPGGAERQLVNTVRGLCALGIGREIVLMPTKDKDPVIDRFHGIGLDSLPISIETIASGTIEIPLLAAALGPDAEDLLALLPGGLRREASILAARFLRSRPEVVHAWSDHRSIAAGVAAALAGVPRIVLSGRTIADAGLRPMPAYFHTVFRALLERPGVVLVNNSGAGARSYAAWLGVEDGRIGVIYNGVDIGALERARDLKATAAHRARLGLPTDALVVGTAIRLGRVKRPLLWVQAAAEVVRLEPRAQFVIVGDGPLRAEMLAMAQELGIADRLHMPGLTSEVVPWFQLMDVVLLTSEREGTSNTALEAQALGIPVVSPAVGGMPETFLPGISGFLVEPDPSAEALAHAVVRALTDQAWRERARPAAQAFLRERFSLERMIRDTLQAYAMESEPATAAPLRYAARSAGVPEAVSLIDHQA